MDMESEFGAAEADFFDVFGIPTVLLFENKSNKSEVVARWDGKAPPSEELHALVCPSVRSAAA